MWSLTLRATAAAATTTTAAATTTAAIAHSSSMQRIFTGLGAKLPLGALAKGRALTGSARASSTSSAAKSTRPARHHQRAKHLKSSSPFRSSKRKAAAGAGAGAEHKAFFPTSAQSLGARTAAAAASLQSALPFSELNPATFLEDFETKKWKKLFKKSTTMLLADLDSRIQDRRIALQKALASDTAHSSRDDKKAFSAELAAIANADANASERSKSRAARRNATARRGRGSDPAIGAAVLDLYDAIVPQLIKQITVEQGSDRRAMLVQQLVLDIMASDPAYWNPHASTLRQQRRRGNNKGRATKLVKGNNPTIDSLDRPPATFADLLAASSAVGASFGIVPMTAVAYAARRGVIPLAEARLRAAAVLPYVNAKDLVTRLRSWTFLLPVLNIFSVIDHVFQSDPLVALDLVTLLASSKLPSNALPHSDPRALSHMTPEEIRMDQRMLLAKKLAGMKTGRVSDRLRNHIVASVFDIPEVWPEQSAPLQPIALQGSAEFVIGAEAEKKALQVLRAADVIGVDGEWKPNFKKNYKPPLSTLQLSTIDRSFVFDMLKGPAAANTSGELVDLMNDAGVFKVGADVAGDIAMLRTHVPPPAADVAHPQWDFQSLKAKGVVDLTTLFRVTEAHSLNQRSLATYVLYYLGESMDKTQQMSNWEDRPLRPAQLEYAALDAQAPVRVFREMLAIAEEETFY